MADFGDTPDLEAWKGNRGDGSWETYWRAGYVVTGQAPIIVEKYCRTDRIAIKTASDAAKEHYDRLVDVGMFVEVKAFIQRWKTRSRGNVEEFNEVDFVTSIVLRPRTDITPAEAIKRAEERRNRDKGAEVG